MHRIMTVLAVLFVLSAGWASAQTEVEVIVDSARMRRGPGLTHSVQHYASSGHVLRVLETNTTDDPPWTWYYAETPSGVRAWIRGDLVTPRTTTMSVGVPGVTAVPTQVQQDPVSHASDPFPVIEDNLCNTPLFRSCRDGLEQELWETGYWAKDRYDRWTLEGVNMAIAFHLNPCKTTRLCPSWEAWEVGRIEAGRLYGPVVMSATQEAQPQAQPQTDASGDDDERDEPEDTPTPVVISQTILGDTEAEKLLARDPFTLANLYALPADVRDGAAILGGFELSREESRSVTCTYWHTAGQDPGDDPVKSSAIAVTDFLKMAEYECLLESSNVPPEDVTARVWNITITRHYSGLGRLRNVKWQLKGTYGFTPAEGDAGTGTPVTTLPDLALTHFQATPPQAKATITGSPLGIAALALGTNNECSGSKQTKGEAPKEVTQYRHTCEAETDAWRLTLTVEYTHDKTRNLCSEEAGELKCS